MMRTQLGVLVALSLLPAGPAMAQETIRVLGLGSVDPTQSPVPTWLTQDPAFEISLVPTRMYDTEAISPEQAARMLRLYFPRTQEILETHNCLLFSGGDVRYFQANKIQMMIRAVEDGAAATTDMGGMSRPLYPDWIACGIWEVFPNDVLAVRDIWEGGAPADYPFRVEVNRQLERNPLFPFLQLGIERLIGGRTRIIKAREGSTVYAWMETESLIGFTLGFRPAAAVIWDYGSGRSLALEAYFGHSWWSSYVDPTTNEYGQDILINYLLDVCGRQYLPDIGMVHVARQSFRDFEEHLSFMGNLLDFVEKFGARTDQVIREVESAEETYRLARRNYLEGDLEGALDLSDQAYQDLGAIGEKAMALRNRALLWIHLIEWLTITATMMICLYALDQLMIKRRLYRQTSSTKLQT